MNDINFTMYKLAGIIAEYDPFHNGHAWQLQQAKALGARRVAVAMSCGLTQRGALPLLPESVRVQAALTCGADLVFALPAPYACSGAECFARAGVQLLAAAGVMKTWAVLAYLPYLVLAGILAGLFTGLCAQLLVGRLKGLGRR